MANYIDRDLAIEMITKDAPDLVYYNKEEAIDCLECVPTADVQEVKCGRWELIGKNVSKCTACGCTRDIRTQIGWNFCPTCGAKMGLED